MGGILSPSGPFLYVLAMNSSPRRGVLLAQLGTPDAPTAPALKRYLAEFLGDRRVVRLPRLLWWPILHGIILRTRPKRSAALYERVWTEEGSPLLVISQAQQRGVAERLGPDFHVALGMTYGSGNIAAALDELVAAGVSDITVLPLFPQYSTTTTEPVYDRVKAWQRAHPEAPPIQRVCSFSEEPGYIAALAASVRQAGVTPTPETPMLISYHGVPQRYVRKGDAYQDECEATSARLIEALALPEGSAHVVYQSRFGPEPWLQPYADEEVERLAKAGIEEISVISPSFTTDCLETIDELGRELAHSFTSAGGKRFTRIACLNDAPDFLDVLAEVIRRQPVPASDPSRRRCPMGSSHA